LQLRRLKATSISLFKGYNLEDTLSINYLILIAALAGQMLLQQAQKTIQLSEGFHYLEFEKELINFGCIYLNLLNKKSLGSQLEEMKQMKKPIPFLQKIESGNLNSNLSMKEGIYIILLQNRETILNFEW
jgi:hypothetical protein